jgi:large subunit ribosomal protein L13
MTTEIIIDATESSLGRIASFASKKALLGNSIKILNCNKVLISGRKTTTINKYKKARARGGYALKGPNISKIPEKIVKRTIRGMLPYKKESGIQAFKKIICYNETPIEFKERKKIELNKATQLNTISLKELSQKV